MVTLVLARDLRCLQGLQAKWMNWFLREYLCALCTCRIWTNYPPHFWPIRAHESSPRDFFMFILCTVPYSRNLCQTTPDDIRAHSAWDLDIETVDDAELKAYKSKSMKGIRAGIKSKDILQKFTSFSLCSNYCFLIMSPRFWVLILFIHMQQTNAKKKIKRVSFYR